MSEAPTRFPALVLARDSVHATAHVHDECTVRAWRAGYYDGLVYLDADGALWEVVEATPTKRPSWMQRFRNSRLQVSLRFAPPRHGDIAELKQRITEILASDPDDDLYEDAVRARVQAASTSAELVQAFFLRTSKTD